MNLSFDVLTFGETMVLYAPAERGSLESAPFYHASIGGAESNCAIGLARLGHSVCWVSRLGRDPFGDRVLKTIRGEGVNVDRVERSDSLPTGLMFKEPGPGNTSRVFYYRQNSAATTLQASQFNSLQAKYLFVTGITPILSDANRELLLHLVDQFRTAGTLIAFDPNMRFKLWSPEQATPVFRRIAEKSDLLIPSLAEAEMITGLDKPQEMLDRLLQLGPSQVVIKAGAQGAWYADKSDRGVFPAYPAVEIDPVGAGDAFCAGLLSGLLEGASLAEAVSRGAALGAFCVSAFGDYAGLPNRLQLNAFVENRPIQGR